MKGRSLLSGLLLPVALLACGGEGGPTGPPPATALVVLVETVDALPVVGAEVRLDPTGRVTTTDGSGLARFPDLAPGEYTVAVVRGEESPFVVSVTWEGSGSTPVRVVLPRAPGLEPLAIGWDGRTVDWGAPDSLQATVGDAPAPADLEWVSRDDDYLGQPVLLGRGPSLSTAALRPGVTRVEARLLQDGRLVQRETVDVSVRYRQAWNVALEGSVPFPDGTVGDVWVEGGVAFVARRSSGGISIVDLGSIAEVGRWTQPGLFTQDVKAAGGVAYVSHEGSPSFPHPLAVAIVDVSDPTAPALLSGVSNAVAPRAHNVFVDGSVLGIASQGTGQAVLVDVSDPTAPAFLSAVSATDATIHDVHLRDGLLFASSLPLGPGQQGELTIADLSSPGSPVVLGRIHYPGAFTHSSWPSADGRTLFVADEVVNAPIRIYDVSSPSAPREIGRYQPRLGTVPHNFQVRGDLAYLAHYKHGIEVVDVSDPARPRLVGFYDTHPGQANDGSVVEGSLFEGVWGIHWTADGRIVASDMNRGLFVFRFLGG